MLEEKSGNMETITRNDYLYGGKAEPIRRKTGEYRKQLAGADLCECKDFGGLLSGEKEKVERALTALLKSGALVKQYPYLEHISSVKGLDQLNYAQYREFSAFLRENVAKNLTAWSEIRCADQETVKEGLLGELLAGTLTEEGIRAGVQEHQKKLEQDGTAEAMKLPALLGAKELDQKPLTFQYLRADVKEGVEIPQRRLKRIGLAREIWNSLQEKGLSDRIQSRLYKFAESFFAQKHQDKGAARNQIKGSEFRDYMAQQLFSGKGNVLGQLETESAAALSELFEEAGKELQKDRGALDFSGYFSGDKLAEAKKSLVLEFLLCGMEQELMAPGTFAEKDLYRKDEGAYDEELSNLAIRTTKRLEELDRRLLAIYGKPEQQEVRKQLAARLRSIVIQMEEVWEDGDLEDEVAKIRNRDRFGVESLKELYQKIEALAQGGQNVFEQPEVKEAAGLYEERKKVLMQDNWSTGLLLPYMMEDHEIWVHMMTDDNASFAEFVAGWKREHPVFEVLKDMPEVYGRQFVAAMAEEMLKKDGDGAYWKQMAEQFMKVFESRKVGGESINDRLESVGFWHYELFGQSEFFTMMEGRLRAGGAGFEALYSRDGLRQFLENSEKQNQQNKEALEQFCKEAKLDPQQIRRFTLQLKTLQMTEEPEQFQKKLAGRFKQFNESEKKLSREKWDARVAQKNREEAQQEVTDLRKRSRKAVQADEEALKKLRSQRFKSASPILAAEGIQEEQSQEALYSARTRIEAAFGKQEDPVVMECLKEIVLAQPQISEQELQKQKDWLSEARRLIGETEMGKKSGGRFADSLLVYVYLSLFKKNPELPDADSIKQAENAWLTRQDAVSQLEKLSQETKYSSLAAEMKDTIQAMRMGIFTMEEAEFQRLAESRLRYFSNADILYAQIDAEVNSSGKLRDYSQDFRDEVRSILRETLACHALENQEEIDAWYVRQRVKTFIEEGDHFRALMDSPVHSGSVKWDDLKAKERNGLAVNRGDVGRLIGAGRDQDQISRYNALNGDQRALFALALMIPEQEEINASLFTARLAAGYQENMYTKDWFQEQVNAYVNHQAFAPEIDYSLVLERLKTADGQMDQEAFDRAYQFTSLCAARYQENIPKDWNRMTGGIPSVEAAAALENKDQELAERRLAECKKVMETPQDLRSWICDQARADGMQDISARLEKMDDADLHLLIRVLQDRTVLDRTTGVGFFGAALGGQKLRVNENARYRLFGKITGENRAKFLAEAENETCCTQAMRSLLSFQLRDDVDLNGRTLQKEDFASGALKRTTMLDWNLLQEAFQTMDEAENAVLRIQAERSSAKIIEQMPNEKAKEAYHDCKDRAITGEEDFTEYIRQQAGKEAEENKDIPALLAGFLSLDAREKQLFIMALQHRDILDVSKKNLIGSYVGSGSRDYVNPQGRDALADEYIRKSYSETGAFVVPQEAFREALYSLLSTQISDDVDFAGQKETGLEAQRSYETLGLDRNGFYTARTTAVDWKLFGRALQFVNRTSSEAQGLRQDREIYYSMGNTFQNGSFEYDTSYMRRNLHQSGNRASRFFSRMLVNMVKESIPGSGMFQSVLVGALSSVNASYANQVNGSAYGEQVELNLEGINENAGTMADYLKDRVKPAGRVKGLTDFAGNVFQCAGIAGGGWEIYGNIGAFQESGRLNEKAKTQEEMDTRMRQEAEAQQTEGQKKLSREGVARNARAMEAAGGASRQILFHKTVDQVLEIAKTSLELTGEPTMELVATAVQAGMDIAHFLRQIYTDKTVLDRYLSLNSQNNEKFARIRKHLETEKHGETGYSDRELYQKAMGYESQTELVAGVTLEIVRSLLFCASRFNSQMQLKLQAAAALTALGLENEIGNTGSAAAERVYQALAGEEYK